MLAGEWSRDRDPGPNYHIAIYNCAFYTGVHVHVHV